MWLFTPFGFYSVVRKPGARVLVVRARHRGDLDVLRGQWCPELGPTLYTPAADYRFRADVYAADLAIAVSRFVASIDYPNFKDAAAGLSPQRHLVLLDVWRATLVGQEEEARREQLPPPRQCDKAPRLAARVLKRQRCPSKKNMRPRRGAL